MVDLVRMTYGHSGADSKTNSLGQRPMQARVYEARAAQFLLLKAPPAAGKSRALMFLALDKLENQGVKKVVVAVPETSIGSSFRSTDLSSHGFWADWDVDLHSVSVPFLLLSLFQHLSVSHYIKLYK